MAITSAYRANTPHTLGQLATWLVASNRVTTRPPAIIPMMVPNPLVMKINSPCAPLRIEGSVPFSTKILPEILKKSNAMPYTTIERISANTPGKPGSPIANRPKRRNHANMLISITLLMPNFFRKNGIARIKSVSLICESESNMLGYFTTKLCSNSGIIPKPEMNGLPYALVSCSAAPSNIEKIKKTAIFLSLNSTKASKPIMERKLRFSFRPFPSGGVCGSVNE